MDPDVVERTARRPPGSRPDRAVVGDRAEDRAGAQAGLAPVPAGHRAAPHPASRRASGPDSASTSGRRSARQPALARGLGRRPRDAARDGPREPRRPDRSSSHRSSTRSARMAIEITAVQGQGWGSSLILAPRAAAPILGDDAAGAPRPGPQHAHRVARRRRRRPGRRPVGGDRRGCPRRARRGPAALDGRDGRAIARPGDAWVAELDVVGQGAVELGGVVVEPATPGPVVRCRVATSAQNRGP